MKKILIFLFAVSILVSCDYVTQPVEPKASAPIDTVLCPAPTFTGTPTGYKKVMLEDYTGHTCGNCPAAELELDDIMQQFGDSVVPVVIHAGYFAKTEVTPYLYDFKTVSGVAYHDFFGVYGNPSGLVNRIDYNASTLEHFKLPSEWKALTSAQLKIVPKANIQIINEYKSNEGKVCIHIKTDFLTGITGNYRLVVMVTEDSIIKPQKDYTLPSPSDDLNYVHRHVLRANVNGTWGDEIIANASAPSSTISGYTLTLNPEWNVSKTYIVAYIYDVANYNVLQVEEKKIK